MPLTNASDTKLASVLTEIGDLGQGTLTSLVLRKKGCVHGRGLNKVVYGNDFVQVLLWTGFYYQALIERSHLRLQALWSKGNLFQTLVQKVRDAGHPEVTVRDVAEAVQETDESFLRVLSGGSSSDQPPLEGEVWAENNPVWEPLRVEGLLVRGAKVYAGPGNPNNPQSPKHGTIYLDGVKLGEKILNPAPNGQWVVTQKAKTVAKDILKSWLPCGLYARYCLAQEDLLLIKVGAEASRHAKEAKLSIEPEAIRSLFKIAP